MMMDFFKVLGGIALLLLGIEMMSKSFKILAGNKFKSIIEKTTNTPLKGIILGIIVTVVIQSSTGVTILTVALVRAGLMNLKQSVGIIMGANIGTTFTIYLMALPFTDYGLLIIFIGVILTFISSSNIKNVGGVILGLGMLFYGLELMDALATLAENPLAESVFLIVGDNWFIGTIVGTVFTAIIQSSTAFMGILVKLYEMNGTIVNGQVIQTVSLWGALPLILGSNIGTTLSSLLASIGGNSESKKAALLHVFFNIIGSIIFIIFIYPYYVVVSWAESHLFLGDRTLALAFAHTFQNVVSTIILFFFIKQQIWLVNKLVKESGPKVKELIFDESLISVSTPLSFELAKEGINQMFEIVLEYFVLIKEYSFKNNSKALEESESLEGIIDVFHEKIHDFLIKLSAKGLKKKESLALSRNLDMTTDLERIGDHLNNIALLFDERYKAGSELSEEGKHDLEYLYVMLDEMMNKAFQSYKESNKELASDVLKLEEKIDVVEKSFRYKFIDRLKSGEVSFMMATNYADVLSNIERIADHLNNIAEAVIEPMKVPQALYLKKHDIK